MGWVFGCGQTRTAYPSQAPPARPVSRHLRGAFGLREDCRTALPERVVLVDDVLTTGATFRACQQVFGAEGVEVVGGVWLAMG